MCRNEMYISEMRKMCETNCRNKMLVTVTDLGMFNVDLACISNTWETFSDVLLTCKQMNHFQFNQHPQKQLKCLVLCNFIFI